MSDDVSRRSTHRQYHEALRDDGDDGAVDEPWPGRLHSSSRRYDRSVAPAQNREIISLSRHRQIQRSAIPARRSAMQPVGGWLTGEPTATSARPRRGLFRAHPLVWLGCGMLVMLLAWTGLQSLSAWWNLHQDDVTYGRPRTAQYDVVVGHNDSVSSPTHLIALNLDAEVVVIELPGGDTSKARIYRGPLLFGTGADLFPVTLTFPDPGGDGKPDMDIHVQGEIIVYLNQHGQFVPQASSH